MMPILPKEVGVYPSELLDETAADSDRHWFVIYTKARHEKAVARELFAKQTSFYLPMIPKSQVIRRRRVESFLPLFSGYLFLFGSEEQRAEAHYNSRVSRVLPVHDEALLVNDLRQVRQLIEHGAPLTPEGRLVPGDRVRVRHGSLQGLEGNVIRRDSGNRLLIAVNYLQQGVSIQIDDFMVEPI